MCARIDSIYYFDYTNRVGRCETLRNVALSEITYFAVPISTLEEKVTAGPIEFRINNTETSRIREYLLPQIPNLEETAKELAENSPQYVCIRYFNGTEKFYKYNAAFCHAFDLVWRMRPQGPGKTIKDKDPAQKEIGLTKQPQTADQPSIQQSAGADLEQTSVHQNREKGTLKKDFQIAIGPALMLFLVSMIIMILEDLSFLSSPFRYLGWLISLLAYQMVAQLMAYLSGYIFIKSKSEKLVWFNYAVWTLVLNLGSFMELLGL